MDAVGERLYPSHHFLSYQRGCSSVDRVLASEAKGRGFDPRQPRHFSHLLRFSSHLRGILHTALFHLCQQVR